MEKISYTFLTTRANVMSRNGVMYSDDVLRQMADQINTGKILVQYTTSSNNLVDLEKTIGVCLSASVSDDGLIVEASPFNELGESLLGINKPEQDTKNDSITLGFCVSATVKDNNVINAKILYSYPLPLIESQWYNEKGE